MYLLYIDETVDTINKVIGVGAILIVDSKCRKYCEEIEKFIQSELKLSSKTEIHADSIWNGRSNFSNFSMNERANLSKKIAFFLGNSNITKFIYSQKYLNGIDKNEAYLQLLDSILDYAVNKVKTQGAKSSKQLILIFDQRQDIKDNILDTLLKKSKEIISKHKTSIFFLDCGYEGLSKYSRLLQAADFISYWSRQIKIIQVEPTLFKTADHELKIKMIDEIKKSWLKKLHII